MRMATIGVAVHFLVITAAGLCGEVRLQVKPVSDPTGMYPSSKLYLGVLQNGTASQVELKAVRMPGGYIGSGTFFNCSVEEWNAKKKAWTAIKQASLSGFVNPAIELITVGPAHEQEVCREMLPGTVGRPGSCVRIRVAPSWESQDTNWVSEPFILGDGASKRKCP